MTSNKRDYKPWEILVLSIAIIVAFSSLFSFFINQGRGARQLSISNVSDKIIIVTAAQSYVEKALTAPSTAKFPDAWMVDVTGLGNGKYRISSYVDSQNAFGSMLRTYYVVEIRYLGDDRWKLENIRLPK